MLPEYLVKSVLNLLNTGLCVEDFLGCTAKGLDQTNTEGLCSNFLSSRLFRGIVAENLNGSFWIIFSLMNCFVPRNSLGYKIRCYEQSNTIVSCKRVL